MEVEVGSWKSTTISTYLVGIAIIVTITISRYDYARSKIVIFDYVRGVPKGIL